MARTTKQLSGAGKDKFLLGLVASTAGVTDAAAEALGERLCAAIADVRVRRDAWEESRHAPAAKPAALPAAAQPIAAGEAAGSAFDPFAFSALAVLTKKGRAALADQFAKISRVADLQALAAAQHLAVDAALQDAVQIREALIVATEARLAERRAAAS